MQRNRMLARLTWVFGDDITVHEKPVIQSDELEKSEESFTQTTEPLRGYVVEQTSANHCKHV